MLSHAFLTLLLSLPALAQDKGVWTDPVKAAADDPDFSVQGEYSNGTDGLQLVVVLERRLQRRCQVALATLFAAPLGERQLAQWHAARGAGHDGAGAPSRHAIGERALVRATLHQR